MINEIVPSIREAEDQIFQGFFWWPDACCNSYIKEQSNDALKETDLVIYNCFACMPQW